jgi:hypothetical protein
VGDKKAENLFVTNVKWLKEGEIMQVICENKENHTPRVFRIAFAKGNKVTVTEEKEKTPVKPVSKPKK